jgi:hypothetical protein
VADHEQCPPHRASGSAAGHPARGPELADDPQAGFRAISGLVLALFVTSVSVGVITTLVASAGPASGTAAANTLVNYFWRDSAGQLVSSVPSVPAQHDQQSQRRRRSDDGVTLVHQVPSAPPDQLAPEGLVLCAQLSHAPAIGKMRARRGGGRDRLPARKWIRSETTIDQAVWPPAPITPEALAALLVVGTNGSTAAVETARTQLEKAAPSRFPPDTLSSMSPDSSRLLAGYKQLANVVILVSLPIAGCSLAVAPGPQYYLIVALGLVVALAILGSTLPMLSRITDPEAARFD